MGKFFLRNRILVFGILIIAIIFLNVFENRVRNFFYLISEPFQVFFLNSGKKISDFFSIFPEAKKLKIQNENLLFENQNLKSEIVALKELEKENKALKQALNLNLADDFDLLLSYFISKDPFSDSFLINKGKNQGILKGMTVISSQKSLIGKIKEVYDDFSRVVLITDKTFSFPCKIQKESEESEDITGIAKGKGNFELFFDLIPQEKQVSPGQKVVTVSLDGEFPKGIFVGEIEAIEKSDLHPFQKAKINPNFDLGNLEVLFVVLNY